MNRKAFTLVELIAATALSTLLFVAALSVIRSLGRVRAANGQPPHGWTLAAREQLQWDLANAIVMRQDDHGMILAGYGSLDPQTFAPTHLPVMVIYSLHNINTSIWLTREQSSLDPLLTDENSSELLCGDVEAFSVTGSYSPRSESTRDSIPGEGDPTPIIFQHLTNTQRVPDRVRIKITLRNDQIPLMDTVCYLR